MKTPIEQFIDYAHTIRLSDEAKGRVRSNLLAHMLANPARTVSPYVSVFSSMFSRPVLALGVFLLVTIGGATTFAASGSLPGDPLYRLKVNVIEPVRGLVAVSPEEKAKWQVSLTEERVKEVEQLATKERMTTEEGTRSRERFDNSIKEARLNIEKLSQDDPETAKEIDDSLEVSLNRHEDALKEVESISSSTSSIEAGVFAEHIRKGSRNKRERDSEDNR